MPPEKNLPINQTATEYSRERVEQDFVAAFEAIGTPAFFEFMNQHFSPEGVLICNCPPELLQLGGTHRGLADTMTALKSFFVDFGVTTTSVGDVVVDGAHIVVNYSMALRHVGTGRTGRVSGLNHYVLNLDRKIAKCNIFLDNASLAVIGDVLESYAATAKGMETARNRRGSDDD
jgi:hypothetical protein